MSKVYDIITETVIKKLQEGIVPWNRPWVGGPPELPKSVSTKNYYQGINTWLLLMQCYDSPWWMTYNQCKKLDGKIIKGENYTPIIFWKLLDSKEDGEEKKVPLLRFYKVWNAEQTTLKDDKRFTEEDGEATFEHTPIELAEKIWNGYKGKPPLKFNGGQAYYSPSKDYIGMPAKEQFKTPENYYSTLFHEMVHSTGHQDRLNRQGISILHNKGKHAYSKEELVAEMGASFLNALAGIEGQVDNSVAYIKTWIARLESSDNRTLLIEAGSKSKQAVNHIIGKEVEDVGS